MAIQISGCTVIDDSRNLTNIGSASATSLGGNWIATQAEAEAGTNNNQVMTPLRVSQAISALAGGGMVDSDINWSTCNVGCAVRGGGNVIRKTGGIIWIVAPSTTQQNTEAWPMGYHNGEFGASYPKTKTITGRSGWFLPDIGMLSTAYACRTYWDTYSGWFYNSATEHSTTQMCQYSFTSGCPGVTTKAAGYHTRLFRVVCY